MTGRPAKSECVVVLPLSPEETCVVVLPPPPKAHDDCHCVFDHPKGSFACCFGLGGAVGGVLEGSLAVLGRALGGPGRPGQEHGRSMGVLRGPWGGPWGPWKVLGGALGGPWEVLGGSLGGPWGSLGGPWGVPGRPWGVPGGSFGVLGRFQKH